MRINVTYEEMRERFRLWCELFLLCAEIQGDEDDELDLFRLDWSDIAEALGKDEDEPLMLHDGMEEVAFSAIQFTYNEPFVYCRCDYGEYAGYSVLELPSKETKKVVELVRAFQNERMKE